MHPASRKSRAAVWAVLALGLGSTGPSPAQDAVGPHRGVLESTKHHRFEVVFTADGFKVFPSGIEGKPLDVAKLSGKATFYHPNSPKPWFERALSPMAGPGQTPGSLDCTIDLSKVRLPGVKTAFEVNGLADPAEPSASFAVPFGPPRASPAAPVRPAPTPVAITFAKSTRADQPAINKQRVCLVSGESLGSMGAPIKATRGNSSVFLCCQACLKKVQANPDQYFGAVR